MFTLSGTYKIDIVYSGTADLSLGDIEFDILYNGIALPNNHIIIPATNEINVTTNLTMTFNAQDTIIIQVVYSQDNNTKCPVTTGLSIMAKTQ